MKTNFRQMKGMSLLHLLLCILLLFCGSALFHAQQFSSGPIEKRQFVVENIFNYTRSHYEPPVIVQTIPKIQSADATPESAFISFISAMQAGDYDWWFSMWTLRSQQSIADQNVKMKRTPQQWIASWSAVLGGKQVTMLERLETGSYVVLVYGLKENGTVSAETFRSLCVLTYEDGHWRATQDLATDAFAFHYLEGKDRIAIVVR